MTRHIISWADLVHKVGYFAWKLIVVFGRKDTVLTIWERNMLADTLPIIFIHLWMVIKQSNSNGYLPLRHRITFPGLIWYPKLVILLEIWELFLEERTYCVDQRGTGYAGRDSPNHSYIYKDGYEIAKQQWISAIMTEAHISWSDLVPKLIILLEIWGLFLVARTLYLP